MYTAASSKSPDHTGRIGTRLAALLIGLVGMGSAVAQTYAVTDLPTLAGYTSCTPRGLNDAGDVVGDCLVGADDVAVVWRGGTVTSLGKLDKGNYSVAMTINARGAIAGDGDTGNYRPQAWVRTGTTLVNYFANNGGNTHALFIGDNGYIGGYYTKSLSGNTASWRGAIWTPDPKKPGKYLLRDLPILAGGTDPATVSSIPSAFNQVGQAAGYATNNVIGQHAAFWNNDAASSIVDLGVFEADWSSLAYGINGFGQVVGSSHPPFGSRPVLWNNDPAHTAIALPVLPGDNYGWATAINNLGQIIGGSYYGTPGTWDALPSKLVIWRDGGVFEMQNLLDPLTGAGLTLTSMNAINNAGQIVASGVRNGLNVAIVLQPLP